MRETQFIQQMHEKWQRFEELLQQPSKQPEKLYDMFIQVMNDLSYAKTFYPNRSVRVYLNGLAQRIFSSIRKDRKSHRQLFVSFWRTDLPKVMWETRQTLLFAFLLFLGGFLIGVVSSAMDESFVATILGADYVAMTETNINKGDPMAVYKQREAFGMSVGIAGNNLFVATLTFVMGIFYTIGSIGILVSNAIMVGAFQYFFIERDLFIESFLTIWIHGTLEISAIIIAGAAGITMGKGLVFPGSYSRLKSFQRSARQGLKIMIGITPIILLTAFFEGFLTRYTDLPNVLRALFILVNLTFVLLYFVFYPRWKARQTDGFAATVSVPLHADPPQKIEWFAIKSTSQILGDTIRLFRRHFRAMIYGSLLSATLFTGLAYFLANDFVFDLSYPFYQFSTVDYLHQLFNNVNWWMGAAMFLALGALVAYVFQHLFPTKKLLQNLLPLLPIYTVVYAMLYLSFVDGWWWMLMLLPYGFIYLFMVYKRTDDSLQASTSLFFLIKINFWQVLNLGLMLIGLTIIMLTLLDTTVFYILFDKLAWIFPFEQTILNTISVLLTTFLTAWTFFIALSLALIAATVLYFSAAEWQEAIQLKAQIQKIGTVRRIKGMEREE